MLLVFSLLFVILIFIVINLRAKFYIVIKNTKLEFKIGLSIFNIPFFKCNVRKKNNNNKLKSKQRIIGKNEVLYAIKKISKKHAGCIKKLNLNIKISSGDAVATSIIATIVSNAVIFFIRKMNFKFKGDCFKYAVIPVFGIEKMFNIDLDCIISVNLVHITYIILMKWRREIHGRKAPNRKPCDYSFK